MMTRHLLPFFLLILCLTAVYSRGIWRKRPKDEEAVSNSSPLPPSTTLSSAAHTIKKESSKLIPPSLSYSSDELSVIFDKLESYLVQMDTLVDSDSFLDVISPQNVLEVIQSTPLFNSMPEVSEALKSPMFQNPEIFKNTLKKGLITAREYLVSLREIISDPSKIQELLQSIPDEFKPLIQELLSGDMSGLQSLVSSTLKDIPGIPESNKQLLMSLLSGNTQAMSESVKSVFQDNSQTELVRQQFLQNPELAKSLGISEDLLQDPKKWEELMKETLSYLDDAGKISDEGVDVQEEEVGVQSFGKMRAM